MKLKLLPAVVLIMFVTLSRLLPHPWNVSPVVALALLAGTYFSKRVGFLLPLFAILLSDLVLGFYKEMAFVYSAYVILALIGARRNWYSVVMRTVFGSVFFFLWTNFGVWLLSGWYSKDLYGLFMCYLMAIPFFRNALLGDLIYSVLLFGIVYKSFSIGRYIFKGRLYANVEGTA